MSRFTRVCYYSMCFVGILWGVFRIVTQNYVDMPISKQSEIVVIEKKIVTDKKESGTTDIPTEEFINQEKVVDIEKIKTAIYSNISQDDLNKMGIAFYDINTENGFDINGDEEYFPASTSKLYTVITLYDMVNAGTMDINKTVYCQESDLEAGAGVLQNMDLSKPIDLKTLADYAIIHSDNIAYLMLYRTLGRNNIKMDYEKIIGHKASGDTFNMSANDAAKLMKYIYDNKDNYYFDLMIENMLNATAKDRIRKYLPEGIVAHKVGNNGSYVHDTAIVLDEDPYILTVFSNNVYNAREKISTIAKLIHENRY